MRGVGDESPLSLERSVEPPEEVIECVPEFLQFALRAVEGEALVQAGRGDPPRRAGDRSDRAQHPAGNEPAGKESEHTHGGQSNCRVDQKLIRVGSTLRRLDGARLHQLMDGLCEPMDSLCQLPLVVCQLILGLRQARHRQCRRARQWRSCASEGSGGQLILVGYEPILDQLQLGQSPCQRRRKLEMLEVGGVRDLR